MIQLPPSSSPVVALTEADILNRGLLGNPGSPNSMPNSFQNSPPKSPKNSVSDTILILGGDGYLGWSLGLALANRTDSEVILVDNLIKRQWEKEVGVEPLLTLNHPEEKIQSYSKIYRKNNLKYACIDLTDYESVHKLIKRCLPKTIINAAQQPSAPFSMMSPQNARTTFDNNSTTNLNVIWAIAAVNPEIRCIALGSAGSYLSIDSDFISQQKVDLKFSSHNQIHQVLNTWLPMQATDIYHQSKVNSFLLNDLCTTLWGLRLITVQQSTIFGHTIPENRSQERADLVTRFNYDHIFGTVVNRFVCQAAVRHPITVYGDGSQTTGLISLNDTIDNFVRLCEVPLEAGVHRVEHNYTHTLSIRDVAHHLSLMTDLEIQNFENPRFESESKQKKVFEVSEGLQDKMNNQIGFLKDLKELFHFASVHQDRIRKSYILPNVTWRKAKDEEAEKVG